MVLDTALLSLKPIEAGVVGSPTTGIGVLAAVGVIAVKVAVGVCLLNSWTIWLVEVALSQDGIEFE